VALSLVSRLFLISSVLSLGGLPSKTKTKRILYSCIRRVVRKTKPVRWEVMLPFESLRGVPSGILIKAKNW